MLESIRSNIADLPESGIVEIMNYGRSLDRDVIALWAGEGDLPTPKFICDAASESLYAGDTFYTWQRGIPELREAIAQYLTRIYGVAISAERPIVTVGGMQAIVQSVQLLCGPGDEILFPAPVWPNIFHAAHVTGAIRTPVTFTFGNQGWKLDLDRLFDSVSDATRAIFINSPGNPTGWMASQEELIAIRDFARTRGLWIIADEVYGRFVYPDSPGDRDHAPSFLEICEPDERLIVVNTFSKNWAMTGWRVGWLTIPEELGQVFENLVQYNTSGVAGFLQHGALAAITQGEDFFRNEMLARTRAARDIVIDTLQRLPRVRLAPPDGAFYAFFSVDGETDSRALCLRLLDEVGVGLAPGTAFGPGAPEFVRLCYCTSEAQIRPAMERLAQALS
jgi:aspartate/methionine/tyrosine aminotransferase